MVLKIILSLILSTSWAYGRKPDVRASLQLAKKLEQEKDYRRASKMYIKLIQAYYKPQHKIIMRAMKNGVAIDPKKVPKGLKPLYFRITYNQFQIIKQYRRVSGAMKKEIEVFKKYQELLEFLEFRIELVDRLLNEIKNHIHKLKKTVYGWKFSAFVDYTSWQRQVTLQDAGGAREQLILTNRGYCAGGVISFQNLIWNWYADTCLLSGFGSISSTGASTYEQKNIPAGGIISSIGINRFVSSRMSEVGLKLSMVNTVQKLTNPTGQFSNWKVSKEDPIDFTVGLLSRWPLSDKLFFQTEFGKYFSQDAVKWAIGIGYHFN